MKAYHWLKADMTAGSGTEPPWTVGETRRITGKCALCERGYHSSPTPWDGLEYATGPILCKVDVSNPVDSDATKQVSRRRTLIKAVNVERALRLVACRFAEDVLPLYEAQYPGDVRPRNAISGARRYAEGHATAEGLVAVWDAARDAALAAAQAAGEATWAALAKYRDWGNEALLAALEEAA